VCTIFVEYCNEFPRVESLLAGRCAVVYVGHPALIINGAVLIGLVFGPLLTGFDTGWTSAPRGIGPVARGAVLCTPLGSFHPP